MSLATKLRRASTLDYRSDPLWSDVVLLLTAEGMAEGSTNFIDKSSYNTIITPTLYTNPIYNTKNQSLIGTNKGSIYFGDEPVIDEGSFLSSDPSYNPQIRLSLHTQWTYECYVKPRANFYTTTNCGVLFYGTRGSNNYRFELELENSQNGVHAVTGYIQAQTSSGIYLSIPSNASTVPEGQWSHLAIVRDNTNYKVFVNGKSNAGTTYSNSIDNHPAQSLIIGMNRQSNRNCSYKGHIDQIRITRAIRYTEDFIPDFKPFPTK